MFVSWSLPARESARAAERDGRRTAHTASLDSVSAHCSSHLEDVQSAVTLTPPHPCPSRHPPRSFGCLYWLVGSTEGEAPSWLVAGASDMMGGHLPPDVKGRYLLSLYWGASNLVMAGNGAFAPNTRTEFAVTLCHYLVSFGLTCYFVGTRPHDSAFAPLHFFRNSLCAGLVTFTSVPDLCVILTAAHRCAPLPAASATEIAFSTDDGWKRNQALLSNLEMARADSHHLHSLCPDCSGGIARHAHSSLVSTLAVFFLSAVHGRSRNPR